MTDNTVLNSGSGGDTIRTLVKSGNTAKTQAVQLDVGGGDSNAEVFVSSANPLPISGPVTTTQGPTNFVYSANGNGTGSTGNSINYGGGSYQLTAGQTFTGLIEAITNEVAISIQATTDQPLLLTINQYMDAAGTYLSSTWQYTLLAGQPFSFNRSANGDYVRLLLSNIGLSATTTLMMVTAYGALMPVTQAGNTPVAVYEFAPTLASTIYGTQYLNVDPSNNATDGAVYNNSQVNQVGVVAGKGQEGFVHAISTDFQGVQNINDKTLEKSQAVDQPVFVSITGNPDGDFSGVDILEQCLDTNSNVGFNTRVINPLKSDLQNATILSDCPAPITTYLAIGQNIIIDTTGYQSFTFTTQALAATGGVQFSNDLITWVTTTLLNNTYTLASGVIANTNYNGSCFSRYLKITATTAGGFTLYLRAAPFTGIQSSNLTYVSGSGVVTSGVSGMLAVGGNIAVGTAPTANPISLAWDGTATRRILTDTVSGGVVPGLSAVNNGQTLVRFVAAATTNLNALKASAGRLYNVSIANNAAYAVYAHFYNTVSGSVTVGTTGVVFTMIVPATSQTTVGFGDYGMYFSNAGWSVSVTKGLLDTDTTVTAANDFIFQALIA